MSEMTRRSSMCLSLAGMTAAGLGLLSANVDAQTPEPKTEAVTAQDGFPIKFTYYPAIAAKNDDDLSSAPVLILLHGEKGSRLNWDKRSAPAGKPSFPTVLQESGYAVLTVDLRKHGQSIMSGTEEAITLDDYVKMGLDLAAVKGFIQEQHQKKQLNMGKLGIISTGFSAPVSSAFAEVDWKLLPHDDSPVPALRTPRGQDVKALVMISPDSAAGRLATTRSVTFLNKQNLSFLFMAGKQDTLDKGVVKNCFKACGGDKKADGRVQLVEPDLKERGIDLFGKTPKDVEVPILTFLEERLKKLTIPWVDRRSRLDRE